MKKKFAFTLIEVLIAITVFAVWVLAVLRILTWNLSIMDHTNMKLQSTVLAKEWLELLYNLRDSNLEKDLQWNCVLDQDIYSWTPADLEEKTESSICAGFFGNEADEILQLSFDKNSYYYQKISTYTDDFDDLFEKNKICEFADDDMIWFAYCDAFEGWEDTFFARYLSFTWINISEASDLKISQTQEILPKDKIIKVESHVLYKKWHKTGDVVFESFIWNY